MLIKNKITYSYDLTILALLQKHLSPKLHFKKKLNMLYLKYPPAYTLANHFTRHGFFLRMYLKLTKQYIYFLRTHVQEISPQLQRTEIITQLGFENLGFYREYNSEVATRNLNYSLLWQALNMKMIVRLDSFKVNKQYKTRLRYIKPERRFFLIWYWVALLAKINRLANMTLDQMFYHLLSNFFCIHYTKHEVTTLKLETYQTFLLARL